MDPHHAPPRHQPPFRRRRDLHHAGVLAALRCCLVAVGQARSAGRFYRKTAISRNRRSLHRVVQAIAYGWKLYGRGSWVLGLVAGLIAIRDHLTTPRVSRHDGRIVAPILIMVAILAHAVQVYPGDWSFVPPREQASVQVFLRPDIYYDVDVASFDRAKEIAAAWQSYRQCWWVFAAIAACLVIREFLRTPRSFGRDDETSSVAASPGEL